MRASKTVHLAIGAGAGRCRHACTGRAAVEAAFMLGHENAVTACHALADGPIQVRAMVVS
jgi:hypothetical protein